MWNRLLPWIVPALCLFVFPAAAVEPAPVEVKIVDEPPTSADAPRLEWEQFRRRLMVRFTGPRIFLMDDHGSPLDEAYFKSEVVGVALGRERVYVATARHGVDVFRVDWKFKLDRVSHLDVEGTLSGLIYDDPYLFVIRPVRRSQVFLLDPAGVVPVREGSLKAPPPPTAAGEREKATGRITRIHNGIVTINLGEAEGFRAGDRIRVLSAGRHSEYNPLRGRDRVSARTRLQAVLTLYEVEEQVARARLAEGEDVKVGDLVQYFNEEKLPQIDRIVRWGGVQRVIATVTPGFLFGDPSLGTQVHYEYQAHMPLTLGVSWRGFLGSEVSASDIRVDAAFDTAFFSIGYQIGFFMEDGEDYPRSPLIGFSAMFLRLGMLDGLHFLFGYRSTVDTPRGFFGRLQLGGTRHNLFAAWDIDLADYEIHVANDPYQSTEHLELGIGTLVVGDRIRLWGNGGHDTMFVTVFLGGQFLFMGDNNSSSFVMGGGVEYRF
jgi:hypothetical protein